MEGWGMGRIHLIGTEYASRGDHTDRQLPLLHGADLYRRCLASQNDGFVNIEGILLVSGRMVLRNVQFFEII